MRLETNVPTKMRDGITLYADIYRPAEEGKYPAILTRLPYSKDVHHATQRQSYLYPQRYVEAGYAVVIQDCRGTGQSEGQHYHQRGEAEDGYDTVEWIAAQPWCTGNVGMYGGSYLGGTQWFAALTHPPHLKVICPAQASAVIRGLPTTQGGVFNLRGSLRHTIGLASDNLKRSSLPPEQKQAAAARLSFMMDHVDDLCSYLPLKDVFKATVPQLDVAPFYADWLEHLVDDEYWAKFYSPLPVERIELPTLHQSGWYDFMVAGVLENYLALGERGGSQIARRHRKLIVGPWVHGGELSSRVDDLDFGPAAAGSAVDIPGILIRWFDYWLKGLDNGILDEPPVKIFVMGDNVWRDECEWPLARTQYTPYYFHSAGRANSRLGDGVLTRALPERQNPDGYVYDPHNPAPSKGGPRVNSSYVGVLFDQQELEKRNDILVYSTPPLAADVEVTGPVQVRLWAASSAVDTDFTAKLVDLWPDGRAYNLIEGIIRARYRESASQAKFIDPGRIYEYRIDLGATSNVFKAGHRIRVEVSSSSFPKWDPNLNTGHPIGMDAEIKVAAQTIYHDRDRPSQIMLPIIPRA